MDILLRLNAGQMLPEGAVTTIIPHSVHDLLDPAPNVNVPILLTPKGVHYTVHPHIVKGMREHIRSPEKKYGKEVPGDAQI
jgi:hypothetical protein